MENANHFMILTGSRSQKYGQSTAGMAFPCPIMSRASAGDKGTVGDLHSWGLELSKGFFIHLSGTGIGITERLVSAGTAPLGPACGFSMYLECLIGWQDSKRSRQKPWGIF